MKWYDFVFIIFLAVFATFGLFAFCGTAFGGEGGMPPQQTIEPPTFTVTTEWIVALCAVAGTILTGVGLWLKHRKKK